MGHSLGIECYTIFIEDKRTVYSIFCKEVLIYFLAKNEGGTYLNTVLTRAFTEITKSSEKSICYIRSFIITER